MKRWKRFTRKDSATVYALQNSLHKSCWSWQGKGGWKKKEQQWFITMIEGLHFLFPLHVGFIIFHDFLQRWNAWAVPTSKVFTLPSVFDDVHLHGGSLFFVKWKGGDRVKGLLNYPFAGNQSSSKCMVMFRDFPGQNVYILLRVGNIMIPCSFYRHCLRWICFLKLANHNEEQQTIQQKPWPWGGSMVPVLEEQGNGKASPSIVT